jgi:hypothetical protein
VPTHSLINYAHWRIVSPESSLIQVGADGYIAQVWTGTCANWESTLTASLLQPEVWRYEVMPWPDRVFKGKYPVRNAPRRDSVKELESRPRGTGLGGFGYATEVERALIPKAYETELQTVIRALGEMKQPAEATRWEHSGTAALES